MKSKLLKCALPTWLGLTLFSITIFGLLSSSVGGCGCTKKGNLTHCTDPNYPLYCADAGTCCPSGYQYYCAGSGVNMGCSLDPNCGGHGYSYCARE